MPENRPAKRVLPEHDSQAEYYFGYDIKLRVVQATFLIAFSTVPLLLVVNTVINLINYLADLSGGVQTSQLYGTELVGSIFIGGPVLLIWAFLTSGFLTMYPAISVRESSFRVHSLIGRSDWLKWSQIKRVRGTLLLREGWMLGIVGLGVLYWPNGLLYESVQNIV